MLPKGLNFQILPKGVWRFTLVDGTILECGQVEYNGKLYGQPAYHKRLLVRAITEWEKEEKARCEKILTLLGF